MPAYRDTVQLIMQEIGPQTPDIDALVQYGEDSWALQLNDTSIIFIEYAADPDRLILSTELGMPVPQRRLDVCQLMLSYNLLWKENAGLTMALGGPEGSATLLCEWRSIEPELQNFQEELRKLSQVARAWRSYIAQTDATDSNDLPALPGLSSFV
ncbi:type III secretion system chaperone|uniref:type III secretion system chaperone n=1 Tax=Noviherbaspirillum sp. L7-7A TaxID=2850560 RepID=UPI001C2CAB84|nr:type III secretion system chaperone [Noviherbaspirillum sp. L7-7A]MBV0879003.1 type III secretion system chaperone [Noviherbaspirillum sp. L7-7A]